LDCGSSALKRYLSSPNAPFATKLRQKMFIWVNVRISAHGFPGLIGFPFWDWFLNLHAPRDEGAGQGGVVQVTFNIGFSCPIKLRAP
jgi:hypothetical protein